jgi:hypothetical protein
LERWTKRRKQVLLGLNEKEAKEKEVGKDKVV